MNLRDQFQTLPDEWHDVHAIESQLNRPGTRDSQTRLLSALAWEISMGRATSCIPKGKTQVMYMIFRSES